MNPTSSFVYRHVGPRPHELDAMAQSAGFDNLDALVDAAVPPPIRLPQPLQLPTARSEHHALQDLRAIATQNQPWRSYLGMGYYDCLTPPVLQRNVLENPGWYTQYTPYQAEIAQGRLEALLTFQTMVCDLTGLEVANASLLDEATAAAEAMTLCHALQREPRNTFLVSSLCHPQTIEVVRTRALPLDIHIIVADPASFRIESTVFGVLLQYPDTHGAIHDFSDLVTEVHASGALVVVATDLLALTLLKPPGEWGADVAVGNSQRFGVPLGFGGPHAGFFATRNAFKRLLPGRLVGVSKDSRGKPALRLTLQTREQHIRREKATSNICTAQALLANLAALYAVYHGPEGLREIAQRIHHLTQRLAHELRKSGCLLPNTPFFDTLHVQLPHSSSTDIARIAARHQVNLRILNTNTIGISLDETVTETDVNLLLQIFNQNNCTSLAPAHSGGEGRGEGGTSLAPAHSGGEGRGEGVPSNSTQAPVPLPPALVRTTPFLTHPIFHRYRSETEMLRYLKRLENRDLSLTTSMIPLGSCTMKLNAACEMFPITWPEFSRIHPFAPPDQTPGYRILFEQLEHWLAEITGFHAVSLQPNAGAQGEYAGLLAIRAWHQSRHQSHRNICLIPTSAHGTNPASAIMAGLKVVSIACDMLGNIDLTDLRTKATDHADKLAALMVTYPSTHGVFETTIQEICQIIHQNGGQVYMDGANMNAQVGLCRPGDIGADVCHLNLHKTFCIPHGGGGPGVGPICVAPHLAPFLPAHPVVSLHPESIVGPVSAAPWGSAGILPIPWVYIATMGPEGLTLATKVAILNANYLATRLHSYFPILYRGSQGLVAHECILDLRPFTSITVEDVAKRLMDYGFHAPTVSWPVAGTLMLEPTESESRAELDRLCDALIAIHAEIQLIESGQIDPNDNPLKNAPHTADQIAAESWTHPYSRETAAFPAPWLHDHKFWPSVSRIDNVYGDRNPFCTCS
jgi:glycine dehydrogenase